MIVQIAKYYVPIVLVVVVGLLVGNLVSAPFLKDIFVLSVQVEKAFLAERNMIRIGIAIGNVMTTLVPALFLIRYFHIGWYKDIGIEISSIIRLFSLYFISIFGVIYVNQIGSQIDFFDYFQEYELQLNQILSIMLNMETLGEFWLMILIVGLLPAIGEELLFRGVLQNINRKLIGNQHVAIWLTAVIFAVVHMQFSGLLARTLLGAILGYSFYYSKNILTPIFLHFLHNSFNVFLIYNFPNAFKLDGTLEDSPQIPHWMGILFLAGLGYWLYQINLHFIRKYQPKS